MNEFDKELEEILALHEMNPAELDEQGKRQWTITLITQAIKKHVIGEDDEREQVYMVDPTPTVKELDRSNAYRNELRAEQRQKLHGNK